MKKAMNFLALALALGAAESASAASVYLEISGNSCHTAQGGQGIPTRYGLYNPGPYGVDVVCPVQTPEGYYTYGYIGFAAYRRNPNDGMSCTLNMTNDDGNYYSGAVASISNYGSARLYASRYTNTQVASDVIWVTCHIPAPYSGSYSYLNSIVVNLQ